MTTVIEIVLAGGALFVIFQSLVDVGWRGFAVAVVAAFAAATLVFSLVSGWVAVAIVLVLGCVARYFSSRHRTRVHRRSRS
jgi:ABC-type sulfate transport system permease component